jgi:hypothetical protein
MIFVDDENPDTTNILKLTTFEMAEAVYIQTKIAHSLEYTSSVFLVSIALMNW